MTIHEAIQAADAAREGNVVSDIQMTQWLSYVDGRVIEELILTHETDLTTRQETLADIDERIRKLEAQQAALDDDDPDPETDQLAWMADELRDITEKAKIGIEIQNQMDFRDQIMRADYADVDPDTVLYIRAPFEDIYLYYLLARIDLLNRESSSHNDNMRQFYTEWKRYANWFNRNSMPTGSRDIRW